MTLYLDTSVVIPLFLEDDHAPRVRRWARSARNIALSAWTLTEATSALSMQVRMKHITEAERRAIEDGIDTWARRSRIVSFEPACLDDARRLLRRHSRLRAPDALHLAIAAWHGLDLATLDGVLRDAALAEGLRVVDL